MADPKDAPTGHFVCRVLFTKQFGELDYVIMGGDELESREDVEVVSEGLASLQEAEAMIERLGGTIPDRMSLFLDHFEEEGSDGGRHTVWCFKDDRTYGASQTFESEEEAIEAERDRELIFESPPLD